MIVKEKGVLANFLCNIGFLTWGNCQIVVQWEKHFDLVSNILFQTSSPYIVFNISLPSFFSSSFVLDTQAYPSSFPSYCETWILALIIALKFTAIFWTGIGWPKFPLGIKPDLFLRTLLGPRLKVKSVNSLVLPLAPLTYQLLNFRTYYLLAHNLPSSYLHHLLFFKFTLSFPTLMPLFLFFPLTIMPFLLPVKPYHLYDIFHKKSKIISLSPPNPNTHCALFMPLLWRF